MDALLMALSCSPVPLLVWGGGTGGVAAALQAARSGASTLLLTPGPWLGGMLSAAGVCCPDGNELSPWQTGLWGALLRALATTEVGGLDHNWVSCFGFRPATAEAILRRWVAAEPLLTWQPNCTLLEVSRQGDQLSRITLMQNGTTVAYAPQIVIDGSDLGDLLALGGADHRWGWEPQELWSEPSAPEATRLAADPFFARQPVQSPTWVAMAQLLDDTPPALATLEQADPYPEPDLPAPFEGATDAFGLQRTLSYGRLPQGLLMLNWPLHGNDWHSDLEGLFGGDPQQQQRHLANLAPQMQAHSLAFLKALQGAGAALQPAALFPEAACSSEALQGPSPVALMPYWREGRRLIGQATVIEQDLLPLGEGARRAPLPLVDGVCSSVAVGNYANDHHYPGGDWPLAAKSCRWGGRWSGTPFCIPYAALVSASTSNLLAADKCISVSHIANGATRLQPLVLNIGQAAGLAAALSLRQGCTPERLPVAQLQRALIEDPSAPAAPFPLWDTPWHHPQWRQRQLACLQDPALITAEATFADSGANPDLDPAMGPAEPHEQVHEGSFSGDALQGYRLSTASGCWPLITLEPALHQHLQTLAPGSRLRAVGCANPWGPWLRLSRLAQ